MKWRRGRGTKEEEWSGDEGDGRDVEEMKGEELRDEKKGNEK